MKSRALEGTRVLDLSRVLAGPFAAQIMGDLGADVIKIEHPERGDDTRHWGPPFWGTSAVYYLTANRNKRSRALDFTTTNGRDELLALIAEADVLVENYKVGSLVKYGLDYATLHALHPRLVYCSITGFGETGPYASRAGYDALVQAMGGLMSITGPDAASPTKVGVAVSDLMAGLYAVIAILAALRARDELGTGQHCSVSLFDTQVSALANVAMAYPATGDVPAPLANAHATIVPYESFATSDRPIMLPIGNDAQFESFARLVGAPEWSAGPRFRTNASRVTNRDDLLPQIRTRLAPGGARNTAGTVRSERGSLRTDQRFGRPLARPSCSRAGSVRQDGRWANTMPSEPDRAVRNSDRDVSSSAKSRCRPGRRVHAAPSRTKLARMRLDLDRVIPLLCA